MVGWFDPGPLLVTGFDVLVSTLFGRHSDYRLLEALAAGSGGEIHDYTRLGEIPAKKHARLGLISSGFWKSREFESEVGSSSAKSLKFVDGVLGLQVL